MTHPMIDFTWPSRTQLLERMSKPDTYPARMDSDGSFSRPGETINIKGEESICDV